jgi:hypothetical protein
MHHAAQSDVLAGTGSFEKNCLYCGARLRVRVIRSPGAEEARPYDCPACGKQYEVQADATPQVRLVHGRTDGKDDRYQETIF